MARQTSNGVNDIPFKPETARERPFSTQETFGAACPFLGMTDDAQTRLLFAAPSGCCYRANPPEAVAVDHQQSHCLTSMHKLCPVFTKPTWDPLPPELLHTAPRSRSRRFGPWLALAAFLLGLALFLGLLFGWGNGRFAAVSSMAPTPVSGLAALPAATQTTALMNTKTVAPSSTPTPTAPTPTPLPTKTAVPSATATTQPTITPSATLAPTYTPLPPPETAVPPIFAKVAALRLNVRSGPGLAYDLLATIEEGTQIELTGRLRDGSWWQICCVNGETVWVYGEGLEIPAAAETAVAILPAPPLPTALPEN
ncbi:MAG: SH3 domain-containing protein [Chloroflexota bacterium]